MTIGLAPEIRPDIGGIDLLHNPKELANNLEPLLVDQPLSYFSDEAVGTLRHLVERRVMPYSKEIAENAGSLTSEAATNAKRHAGGPTHLHLGIFSVFATARAGGQSRETSLCRIDLVSMILHDSNPAIPDEQLRLAREQLERETHGTAESSGGLLANFSDPTDNSPEAIDDATLDALLARFGMGEDESGRGLTAMLQQSDYLGFERDANGGGKNLIAAWILSILSVTASRPDEHHYR